MSRYLANTGWTNEARAVSLAVRQAKAAKREAARSTNPKWDEKPGDGFLTRVGKAAMRDFTRTDLPPPSPFTKPKSVQVKAPPPRVAGVPETDAERSARLDAADQAADALREPGLTDGTAFVSSVGDGEVESQRDLMFQEQRQIAGKDFHGNWYPDGDDGGLSNPYVGPTAADAPYGYHEITHKPRTEPLYSHTGMPIVPRTKEEWDAKDSDLSLWQKMTTPRDQWPSAKSDAYAQKVQALAYELGPYGSRKAWMARHPGATEAQWMAADQANYEASKQREERVRKASDARRERTKSGQKRSHKAAARSGGGK